MPRPKRNPSGASILYVDIVLDNGVRWRITPRTQHVQEIEEQAGHVVVRGPVRLKPFINALEQQREKRNG